MLNLLSRNWWTFLIRGICAIVFGVLIFMWPASLILVFGIFALTDGVLSLVAAMFGYSHRHRGAPTWWLVTMGILGVIVGLFTLHEPKAAAVALLMLLAAWLIISGIFALFGALGLPAGARGKSTFIANAILSLVCGIVIFSWPIAAAVSVAWVLAFYAIFIGVSLIGFGFQVRKIGRVDDEVAG